MWYMTKVGPDVESATGGLAVHMSHPGPEHWKTLGNLIGYLKGKETKGIVVREPKVLRSDIFCYYNYATDKDTRNSVSGLFTTLEGIPQMCSSKTQRTVTLSIIDS